MDTTIAAGAVEIHKIDAGGVINPVATETLSIPQADTNITFGRSLATMKFNGQTILVVGATNVIYAYYQTSLYGNTRQ